MNISVSGYNYSGSGAVLDLLKEYEEINVVDSFEMTLIDFPDGIRDLEYHINGGGSYFNGDMAVRRFMKFIKGNRSYQVASHGKVNILVKEYLKKLETFSWKGRSSFDRVTLAPVEYWLWMTGRAIEKITEKILKRHLRLVDREMHLVPCNESFQRISRNFMDDMIESVGGKKGAINVLDQLFPAHNPRIGFPYVHEPRAIVVDRDPRDIYVLCKQIHHETCFPTDDVKKFIEYHKRCWGEKVQGDKDVLYIQFEDLIFNYATSIMEIEKFLQVEKHSRKGEFFKPEVSINNTQIYTRFPELADEIRLIELELKDYLYHFPEKGIEQKKRIF